jgi:hypothetical protein
MSNYAEHFKIAHDDELIERALRGGLVEEAEVALQSELAARGIHDLSAHAKARDSELQAEEAHRNQQLATRAKGLALGTRLLYTMAALVFAFGVVLFVRHDPTKSTEDGGLVMLIGIAGALFAFVRHRLSKLWVEHVLLRRPPR